MTGKLYFFSGKMGVGKTTYAKTLAKKVEGLYLSEDNILTSFYPTEINDIKDYITYSIRIKPFLKEHILSLLHLGNTIIMDFPGNTIKQRQWFKELLDDSDAEHELLYLKATDELCLTHINKRRSEQPKRHRFDTKEVFHKMTSYFEEPRDEEGFHLRIIDVRE